MKRSTSRSETQNVHFGETKSTRNLIVAAKAYGKKGIVISTVKKGFLICTGATGRVSFRQYFQLSFQLVKAQSLRSFLPLESNHTQKRLQRWFKGNRGHPKLVVELGSVSHVLLTLKA